MGWAMIPALAASALGTGLSMTASSEESSAANQAAQNEVALQDQFAKQGKNVFEQSLSQSTPQAVKSQMQQGQQEALQNYAQLAQQGGLPGQGLSQPANASAEQSQATENAIVGGKVGQGQQASSALQGYGASDVAQWLKDLQAKTQLNQIGTFAQQNENTLPLQLQQAMSSQSTLAGIGSLLSSVGGLGSLYGAVNSTPSTPSAGYGNWLNYNLGNVPQSGAADWNANLGSNLA